MMKEENLYKQYAEEKFEEAISSLNELKGSLSQSAFFYNVGVLKIKQGDLIEARLAFENSIQAGNIGVEARHNINYIKTIVGLTNKEPLILNGYFHSNYFIPSFIAVLLSILIIILRKNKKALIISGLSSLITFGALFLYLKLGQMAVIGNDANVYEGPSELFRQDLKYPSAVKVFVNKKQDGWGFIRFPEEYAGWVKLEKLKIIK